MAFRYKAQAIGARFLSWRAGAAAGFAYRFWDWQAKRKLARDQRRRDKHKQHWQAGKIGGGAIVQLGFMTESQAIERVQSLKGENEPIAFIDFERGFIAHGTMPDPG